MSKYFNDENGQLKSEYLKKITDLQDEIEAKYQAEYSAMSERSNVLKKAFDDAEKAYREAYNYMETCKGKWFANDQGYNLSAWKHSAKKKIMDDNMKVFNALQTALDEKDGTAQKRRELAAACQFLDLQPEKLSILDEIAKDEAESKAMRDEA